MYLDTSTPSCSMMSPEYLLKSPKIRFSVYHQCLSQFQMIMVLHIYIMYRARTHCKEKIYW